MQSVDGQRRNCSQRARCRTVTSDTLPAQPPGGNGSLERSKKADQPFPSLCPPGGAETGMGVSTCDGPGSGTLSGTTRALRWALGHVHRCHHRCGSLLPSPIRLSFPPLPWPNGPLSLCRRVRGCVPPLSPCPAPSLTLPASSSSSFPSPHSAESLVPSPRPGPPPRPGQGDGAQPPPAPRRAGGGGRAGGRTRGAAAPLALDLLAGQVSGVRGAAGGSTAGRGEPGGVRRWASRGGKNLKIQLWEASLLFIGFSRRADWRKGN